MPKTKITPKQARAILDALSGDSEREAARKALAAVSQDLIRKAETIVPMIGSEGMDDSRAALNDATAALQSRNAPSTGSPAPIDDDDLMQGGEQPTVGPEDFLAYVYGAILDEVKAAALYDALKTVAPDEATRTIIEHIRQEEVDHIEELKRVVANLQRLTEGGSQNAELCLGRPQNNF